MSIFSDLVEVSKPLKMRKECIFQHKGCPCDGCDPDFDKVCLMW